MTAMIDPFGRAITYLRMSVTDRCDLRCAYCMSEHTRFLPRPELLTLEELERIAGVFIGLGVRKIRISGGEPLVRRDVIKLFRALGKKIGADGLDELTLTTNGTQMPKFAEALAEAGVRRVNISLDTRDPERFRALTRFGDVAHTLAGIEAARTAGLRVKINTVAMKGVNDTEILDLVAWCGEKGLDLSFIEVMPMGDIGVDRADQFLPLTSVRETIAGRYTLIDEAAPAHAGPARFARVRETGCKLGFISPLTGNFCAGCNRVRLTCTGQFYLCLGRTQHVDLRSVLRATDDDAIVAQAVRDAILIKPDGHRFDVSRGAGASVERQMNVTGG